MAVRKSITYRAGSYIYIEGDEDVEDVYLVEDGQIEFSRNNESVIPLRSNAGPGDIFGVITCLTRRPRMESAKTRTAARVAVFPRETFLGLLQRNVKIAIKLLNIYANELRAYDTMIMPMEEGGSSFSSEESALYELGKHYLGADEPARAMRVFSIYLSHYPAGMYAAEAAEKVAVLQKSGARVHQPVPRGMFQQYANGQVIFCEHEPGDELYFIREGKVKIIKYMGGAEVLLSVLKEGDIFGEMAIVSDKPRNATAVSFGPSTLLPIKKSSLGLLVDKSPQLLRKIFMNLSQRVWFTIIRMESRVYTRPITRIYAYLENKLIEDSVPIRSKEPHTFNFGIDELLKMTSVPHQELEEVMDELMADQNLTFNLGQSIIENPSLVVSKARYYKSRDHLAAGEEHDESMGTQQQPVRPVEYEEERPSPSPEPAVPSDAAAAIDTMPDNPDSLLAELDRELSGDEG